MCINNISIQKSIYFKDFLEMSVCIFMGNFQSRRCSGIKNQLDVRRYFKKQVDLPWKQIFSENIITIFFCTHIVSIIFLQLQSLLIFPRRCLQCIFCKQKTDIIKPLIKLFSDPENPSHKPQKMLFRILTTNTEKY